MAIYSLWQKKLVWMEFWHLNVVCFVMWTEGLNEMVVGVGESDMPHRITPWHSPSYPDVNQQKISIE
jgi:hypothetical protein